MARDQHVQSQEAKFATGSARGVEGGWAHAGGALREQGQRTAALQAHLSSGSSLAGNLLEKFLPLGVFS